MSFVAVAIGGSALLGAISAHNAANAQKSAARGQIAATQQNYDNTAQNLNPYIDAGKNALGTITDLNNGNFSSFTNAPDYQFAFDQQLQGLDRSAAARGSLYSGGHSTDVMNIANGLASQNYNNYYSKLAALAGNGQSAAANLGSVGTGNAAAIGAGLQNQANASSFQAGAYSNLLGGAATQLAQLAGQRSQSSYLPAINTGFGSGISAPQSSGLQIGDIQQNIRPIAYNYG